MKKEHSTIFICFLAYYIFFQGNSTNWKHSIAIFSRYLKVIRKITQKAIYQIFQCFVITLLKWTKYKNRLIFAYYSITFWDFKSPQGVLKTWKVLKANNYFLKQCSNIEIPFIIISNPDFSLFFPVITGTV